MNFLWCALLVGVCFFLTFVFFKKVFSSGERFTDTIHKAEFNSYNKYGTEVNEPEFTKIV